MRMLYRPGFSLIEVLISLSIFSFSSISLFQYQFKLVKIHQAEQQYFLAKQRLDDVSEVLLGHFPMPLLLEQQIHQELHGSLNISTLPGKTFITLTFNPLLQSQDQSIKRLL